MLEGSVCVLESYKYIVETPSMGLKFKIRYVLKSKSVPTTSATYLEFGVRT